MENIDRIQTLNFELGQDDQNQTFTIPKTIYGRQDERAKLQQTFEQTIRRTGRPQVVRITGEAGVGKTTLATTRQERGAFISGQYDKFHQNVPYYGLRQAFDQLYEQFLLEDDQQKWQKWISPAITGNETLLLTLSPQFQPLIIKPANDSELPNHQPSRLKLHSTFYKLIDAVSRVDHPLILLLDNCEWIDVETLALLTHLVNQRFNQPPLIILSYRERTRLAHKLPPELTELPAIDLPLEPHTRNDLAELLQETLKRVDVAPLTELVYRHTRGNIFFAIEFLENLHEDGLLYLIRDQYPYRWDWDLEGIETRVMNDDLIDLLTTQLTLLPQKTQRMLAQAASIGQQFDLKMLAHISEQGVYLVLRQLWLAVNQRLIIPQNENFRLFTSQPNITETVTFRFAHSHLHQTAYRTLTGRQQAHLHYRIGQTLADTYARDQEPDTLFRVVEHFNRALSQLDDEEAMRVAQLNLAAGRHAQASLGYKIALNFFETGLHLLPPDSWERDYQLSFDLHRKTARTAYFTDQYDRAQSLHPILLRYSRTPIEQAEIYLLQIEAYQQRNQYEPAFVLNQEALTELGLTIPKTPDGMALLKALRTRLTEEFGDNPLVDLADLCRNTDPTDQLIFKLLINLQEHAALLGSLDLTVWATDQIIRRSLANGYSSISILGYLNYAYLEGRLNKDYEQSRLFSQFALKHGEKSNSHYLRSQLYLVYATQMGHWFDPLSQVMIYLEQAYQMGLQSGNVIFAGYAAYSIPHLQLIKGYNIETIEQELGSYDQFLSNYHPLLAQTMTGVFHQPLRQLKGETDEPYTLDDDHFKTDDFREQLAHDSLPTAWFDYMSLRNQIILGNYNVVDTHLDALETCLQTFDGQIQQIELYFWVALAFLQISPTKHKTRLKQYVTALSQWADCAPQNYHPKLRLLQAEISRTDNQLFEAMRGYDAAIAAIQQKGWVHLEGLANELAARFWFAQRKPDFATNYLNQAYQLYDVWGGRAKTRQLTENYQMYLDHTLRDEIQIEPLDLHSLTKAALTISGEFDFNTLLNKVLSVVLENAGAERAVLLLPKAEQWVIIAEGSVHQSFVIHSNSLPLTTPKARRTVSSAIIESVSQTQEAVILNQATLNSRFGREPYIKNYRPESILCLPLLHQSQLTGVLYLENRLSRHLFSTNRVTVLKFLGVCIASALANTQLYRQLEQKENRYRTLFESSQDAIIIINTDGVVLELNEASKQLLGYTLTELNELESHLLYANEQEEKRLHDTLAMGEGLKGLEIQFRHKSGNLLDVLITASLWRNSQGQSGYQAMIRDISAQKQNQRFLAEYNQRLRQEVEEQTIQLTRERNRLRALIDHLPDFIFIKDTTSRFITVNESMTRLAGQSSPANLIGKTDFDFFQPAVAQEAYQLEQEIFKTGQPLINHEERIVGSDGETRWMLTTKIPYHNENDLVAGLVGLSHDITLRKQIEQAINLANQKLAHQQQLAESKAAELAETLEYLQAAQQELIQAEKLAALGQLVANVAHEINSPLGAIQASLDNIDYALDAALPVLPQMLETLSGVERDLFFQLIRHATTVHEETQTLSSRESRQQRREFTKTLTAYNIKNQTAIANTLRKLGLAHSVEAYLPLLRHPDATSIMDVLHYMIIQQVNRKNIKRAVKRAAKMVFALKSYTHRDVVGKPVQQLVTDGLGVVLTIYHNQLKRGITVQTDYEQTRPIWCFPEQLNQIWTNLIHNAIQAMQGQGELLIRVQTQQRVGHDYVTVQMIDNGPGIPEHLRSRIFEPFFTTKAAGEGSGLGLDIVQRIVDRHQGFIDVDSKPGHTCFTVWLPVTENNHIREEGL